MGHRSHPRQELHRQRCGAHDWEAEAVFFHDPGSPETARLPGQCRPDRQSGPGSRDNRGGDAHGALGSRPRRARFSRGQCLHVPARPDPAGGLFADSRRAACRRPPAHRPRAAGEHDDERARRTSVRYREPIQSGRRTADRPGRKAKASAAFVSAGAYFSAGMALLDERNWGSQYELTFSLWLERAECELLSGNFEKAEQLIMELLQRGASKVDLAAVYHLKVLLHILKSENPQAVDSALACLNLFGIDIPAHPSWEQVQAEYETVWRNLEGRRIEDLVDLPLMKDAELQAAMRLLSVLSDP